MDKHEQRSRALFEQAGVGVAEVDAATGRFLQVNEKLCAIVGYPREELLRMGFPDITHPEDLAADLNLTLALSKGEIPDYSMEKRYIHKDGRIVWVNLTVSRLLPEAEGAQSHIGVVQDISSRKAAEAESLAREMDFRAAFEQGAVGMAQVSKEGRFVRVNQRFCEILGYGAAELTGRTFQEFTHPEDQDLSSSQFRAVLEGLREDYRFQKRYVRKDGRVIWVDLSGRSVRNEAGDIRYLFSAFQDVTERMEIEETLTKRELLFQAFTEKLPILVFRFDKSLRYSYVNPAVQRITGLEPAALLGRTCDEAGMPQIWSDKLGWVFQTSLATSFEFELPTADGVKLFSSTLVPEMSAQDAADTVLGIAIDVTHQRKAEWAVQTQLDELRRWHDVTLGRESRILELKGEVNDLLSQAGQPPRYHIPLDEEADPQGASP